MVFTFKTAENKLDPNSKQLMYDYFSVLVYKNSSKYIKTVNAEKVTIPQALEIQYKPASSSPNVTYPDGTNTYAAQNLYFYGLIHNNILDVTCDSNGALINPGIVGELVIQNGKLTGGGKIYLCFLLATDETLPYLSITSNDIDRIISMVITDRTSVDLNISTTLNGVLPVQNSAITYTSEVDTVVVFTTPVYINNSSASVIKPCNTTTTLFKKEPAAPGVYGSLTGDNIKTKGIDDIYIDCQPTGESAETINTYQVPVNSEYTRDASRIDLYKTTVQLCIVFTFMVVSYYAIPTVYKMIIIDLVNKFVLNPEDPKIAADAKEKDKIKNNKATAYSIEYLRKMKEEEGTEREKGIDTFVRIASLDFWIFMFVLIIFVIILTKGGSGEMDAVSAIYFVIFFIMGYANVKFSKISASFMQSRVNGEIVGDGYPAESKIGTIINFLEPSDIFFGLFSDLGKFFMSSEKSAYVGLFWVFGLAILHGTIWGLNSTKPEVMPKELGVLISIPLTLLILIGAPVGVLSNISRDDFYNKMWSDEKKAEVAAKKAAKLGTLSRALNTVTSAVLPGPPAGAGPPAVPP